MQAPEPGRVDSGRPGGVKAYASGRSPELPAPGLDAAHPPSGPQGAATPPRGGIALYPVDLSTLSPKFLIFSIFLAIFDTERLTGVIKIRFALAAQIMV